MQRHAPGVNGGDTGWRGNNHPPGAFFLDLVQKRRLACAGLACEKNILPCVANVFEREIELRIGNETHVMKFATREQCGVTILQSCHHSKWQGCCKSGLSR